MPHENPSLQATQNEGVRLPQPKHILLIKSHSMGVGDVLRSSAAWRALKARYGDAQLHLLFLSKHPGYATESLIKEHHLLSSAHFLTLRQKSPQDLSAQKTPMRALIQESLQICIDHNIDMIIDFEMHGMRSAWLTWRLQKKLAALNQRVQTVGVGQFFMKRFFYDQQAPSLKTFAKTQGLSLPMDYTNRDFVALSVLGIERHGTSIELRSSQKDKRTVEYLLQDFQATRLGKTNKCERFLLGLNIGCGTPDAVYKRPAMPALVQAMASLFNVAPFDLLLTGAPFEKDVNETFLAAFEATLRRDNGTQSLRNPLLWMDCAGKTSLPELSALIERCDLLVSTDSGPYHMSVALKRPTLAWFIKEEQASYHEEAWCKHVVNPSTDQFTRLALSLLEQKIL